MSVNSVLSNVASQITGAIRQAAQSTGISFEYLLTTAQIESNLNPSAQAPTSSAKGLYQFIEQTWLGTVKTSGPANGYGTYADAISRSANGRYEVADPAMRTAIMKLRSDPAASAMMAGSFTRNNAEQLRAAIGRQPTEGELYIAHFLGPDGASRLIGAVSNRPNASAAEIFPQAAAANPSIFYSSFGQARSVGDVYAKLTGRFETARAMRFAPAQTAAPVQIAASVRAAPPVQTVAPVQTTARARTAAPDTAGVAQAFAQANVVPPQMPEARPLFQSMFTDRPRGAVAQTVTSLWTPAKSGAGSGEPVRTLDLFTDSVANPRKLFSGDAT